MHRLMQSSLPSFKDVCEFLDDCASAVERKEVGDETQMSLIYSTQVSVDGYVGDEHGRFAFTIPDEEVNLYNTRPWQAAGKAFTPEHWPSRVACKRGSSATSSQ